MGAQQVKQSTGCTFPLLGRLWKASWQDNKNPAPLSFRGVFFGLFEPLNEINKISFALLAESVVCILQQSDFISWVSGSGDVYFSPPWRRSPFQRLPAPKCDRRQQQLHGPKWQLLQTCSALPVYDDRPVWVNHNLLSAVVPVLKMKSVQRLQVSK